MVRAPTAIFMLFFLVLSPLWGQECFIPIESQEDFEAAFNCKAADETFSSPVKSGNLQKIITQMKLYPVYTAAGKFHKFITIDGPFKKGRVLVGKPGMDPDKVRSSFADYDVYNSNHYRADLSCFASHQQGAIPNEIDVVRCVDEIVHKALEKHEIKKIKIVSVKKMLMIYKESSGLFDTLSQCSGGQDLTFFEGKVYNKNDMGNFIWGAILERLKVSDTIKRSASTLDGYVNSGRRNQGFFKSTHLLGDHPKDQKAIFDGARWMRRVADKKPFSYQVKTQ